MLIFFSDKNLTQNQKALCWPPPSQVPIIMKSKFCATVLVLTVVVATWLQSSGLFCIWGVAERHFNWAPYKSKKSLITSIQGDHGQLPKGGHGEGLQQVPALPGVGRGFQGRFYSLSMWYFIIICCMYEQFLKFHFQNRMIFTCIFMWKHERLFEYQ